MAFENYNIRQFIAAMFNDDRSIMNDEEYKLVYTEYIDVAGLYDEGEFHTLSYIHYLNGRINTIKISIRLQREFLIEFGVPYEPNFSSFSKYGHRLFWNNKEELFLITLDRIEKKEFKYLSKLETEIRNLKDASDRKNKNEPPPKKSRGSFIRIINFLGKCGFKIDNDKTTVEELAYMIKQQSEDNV